MCSTKIHGITNRKFQFLQVEMSSVICSNKYCFSYLFIFMARYWKFTPKQKILKTKDLAASDIRTEKMNLLEATVWLLNGGFRFPSAGGFNHLQWSAWHWHNKSVLRLDWIYFIPWTSSSWISESDGRKREVKVPHQVGILPSTQSWWGLRWFTAGTKMPRLCLEDVLKIALGFIILKYQKKRNLTFLTYFIILHHAFALWSSHQVILPSTMVACHKRLWRCQLSPGPRQNHQGTRSWSIKKRER